jgi:hypothetical protein
MAFDGEPQAFMLMAQFVIRIHIEEVYQLNFRQISRKRSKLLLFYFNCRQFEQVIAIELEFSWVFY